MFKTKRSAQRKPKQHSFNVSPARSTPNSIQMKIAVDFDGTIVEHKYPAIGAEIPFATATLRHLIDDGHHLILWSVREGKLLDEAVEWCRQRGVYFYAVNADYEGEKRDDSDHFSRKLKVDCFIDDRNIGGLPDWGVIYQLIKNHQSYTDYLLHNDVQPQRKSWLKRLFG